jgi:hypothetical protein
VIFILRNQITLPTHPTGIMAVAAKVSRSARLRLLLTALAGFLMLVAASTPVFAMRVGGTLVNAAGQPLSSRDLHFQNCVTYDVYLSPTHKDGSFAQQLAPGCYQLRNETGTILLHHIYVTKDDVNVGQVREEPSSWNNWLPRTLQMQTIFPTLLTSPAPSTAYVFTRDLAAGLLPASAVKVPVPTSASEWLRLQKQSESIDTNVTAPPPQMPTDSPNTLDNIPPPTTNAPNPLFSEPSFNPHEAVPAPAPGAMRASPYQ